MRLICGNSAGNNQKGFSPILIILLILVLLIGVGAGAYFFRDSLPFLQSNTALTTEAVPVQMTEQETTSSASEIASGQSYKSYVDSVMGVTFKVPSSWYANKGQINDGASYPECITFSEMKDWGSTKNLGNAEPPINSIAVCLFKGKVEPWIYANGEEKPSSTIVPYEMNGLKGLRGQTQNVAEDNPADLVMLSSNLQTGYIYSINRQIGANKEFEILLKSFRELK